jgi:hypothetical protein
LAQYVPIKMRRLFNIEQVDFANSATAVFKIGRSGRKPASTRPAGTGPDCRKKGHAAFPLPEGSVSLSFAAEMSVASAQMMAAFVKLLLEQAEQQAKIREGKRTRPPSEAAYGLGSLRVALSSAARAMWS